MKSEKGSAIVVVLIIVAIIIIAVVGVMLSKKETEGKNETTNSVVKSKKGEEKQEEKPKFNKEDYVKINEEDYLKYKNVFKEINIETVSFKNLNSTLTKEFEEEQDEILDELATQYNYISQKTAGGLANNCSAKTTVFYAVTNDILTVQYTLNINIDFSYGMSEVKTATLNIDLENMQKLSVTDMFERYDINAKEIATQLFDGVIYSENDPNFVAIDAKTKQEVTYAQLGENKSEYIDRIKDSLSDFVQIRVEDKDVYIIFKNVDLVNVCFEIPQSGPFEYTTLKLEAK